ncbi:hypothetical protein LCL89_00910 [Halobacillus yeomjeoni]|uniref:PilN domain-containing protein n=1 Tax=Halobacillus yeomjeoni TaxID=311194 RepID=UPI001CD3FBA4|nr:hypothetical protein [Halobacillus yeomjeoni]MCA0982600.1 hypothetical protein [Halobacillus yeomjeoni]
MTVEINLLEQREKRNVLPLLILAMTGLIIIISLITISLQKNSLETKVVELESEIESLQIQQATIQQSSEGNDASSREKLQASLNDLEDTIIPSLPIVERLVSLLPERGFFESFVLTGSEEVSIDVRFDTMQEVAKYTKALQQQDFITKVELNNVSTNTVDTTEDIYDYRPRYIADYFLILDKAVLLNEGGQTQ